MLYLSRVVDWVVSTMYFPVSTVYCEVPAIASQNGESTGLERVVWYGIIVFTGIRQPPVRNSRYGLPQVPSRYLYMAMHRLAGLSVREEI